MTDIKKNRIKNSKILVIDDHRNIRISLKMTLEGEGALVDEGESFSAGRNKIGPLEDINSLPYDLILLDLRLPDGNGLDMLRELNKAGLASRVIIISGEGTVSDAFLATQEGAFDYIEKPFSEERILVTVVRCLEFNKISHDNQVLEKRTLKGQEIIGQDPAVLELLKTIKQVAPTLGRILVQGESGTGKELVARAIHRLSERKDQPLIKVNCAAIPASLVESELFGHEKGAFTGAVKARKGVFEQASGGTLFLDEIGELSAEVQAKLLRVLQSGDLVRVGGEKEIKVDVRLITATHRDLKAMIDAKEFREDLFYRLNVVNLAVSPLRDRKSDIPTLTNYFLTEICEEHSIGFRSFSDQVLKDFQDYHWPGNIRELRNIIERSIILSESQMIEHVELPKNKQEALQKSEENALIQNKEKDPEAEANDCFTHQTELVPWQEFHTNLDRSYIKFVLNHAKGNVSEAARILCLERAYLHRLMKKLGVQRGIVVSD